jgi:nitrite reductase (NADH) small subunit
MSDIRWIRVARREWIPPREGRSVRIGEREIAVFNLGPSAEFGAGDRFHATDNVCPHQGGPLCDGIVTGRAVVCPLHGWKINLESGAIERPAGARHPAVRTYTVRQEGGVIAVGIPLALSDDGVEGSTLHNCHQIEV